MTLVQPLQRPGAPAPSPRRELTFSGGGRHDEPVDVDLTPASLTNAGQRVTFPSRSFTQVEFTIMQTSNGTLPQLRRSERRGAGRAGHPRGQGHRDAAAADRPVQGRRHRRQRTSALSIMLTRDRANPQEPFKTDTELSMSREFTLPTTRTFSVGGTARISAPGQRRHRRRAARPDRQRGGRRRAGQRAS